MACCALAIVHICLALAKPDGCGAVLSTKTSLTVCYNACSIAPSVSAAQRDPSRYSKEADKTYRECLFDKFVLTRKRTPSKRGRSLFWQGNSSDNGGHGFKRCLPFVRTDWRYIFGGMLTSITLGAQMPGKLACLQICISSIQHFSCNQLTQIYCLESAGFALALSGITHVYYDPNPDDVKSGGRLGSSSYIYGFKLGKQQYLVLVLFACNSPLQQMGHYIRWNRSCCRTVEHTAGSLTVMRL